MLTIFQPDSSLTKLNISLNFPSLLKLDSIQTVAAVGDIAIFSIPDKHKGELPVAAVIWKEKEDTEGLLKYAHENLARYKIPRKVYSTDKLPRVNDWKLLRKELIKIFEPKMVKK